MSARKLLEGDVNLIIAEIKSKISSALADTRADRNDAAVSTESPSTQSYFTYARATGYKLPAVFVIGESMNFQQSAGPNFVKSIDHINVTVVIEDKWADKLVTKAFRYMAALHEILEQANLTTSDNKLKIVCKIVRAENSALYSTKQDEQSAENVFRKEVSLYLEVEHWESL